MLPGGFSFSLSEQVELFPWTSCETDATPLGSIY